MTTNYLSDRYFKGEDIKRRPGEDEGFLDEVPAISDEDDEDEDDDLIDNPTSPKRPKEDEDEEMETE